MGTGTGAGTGGGGDVWVDASRTPDGAGIGEGSGWGRPGLPGRSVRSMRQSPIVALKSPCCELAGANVVCAPVRPCVTVTCRSVQSGFAPADCTGPTCDFESSSSSSSWRGNRSARMRSAAQRARSVSEPQSTCKVRETGSTHHRQAGLTRTRVIVPNHSLLKCPDVCRLFGEDVRAAALQPLAGLARGVPQRQPPRGAAVAHQGDVHVRIRRCAAHICGLDRNGVRDRAVDLHT